MLSALLWALLGLVGLAIAALAVPLDLAARFDSEARPRIVLRAGWLFGLVRVKRALGARGSKPAGKAAPPRSAKRPRKRSRSRRPNAEVASRGIGLAGELLRRVQVRHAAFDLRVGADDPATTGEIVGFAAPIVAMANALPCTRVSLLPDFTGPTLEGSGEGEVRIVPIALVPPLAGFALSPELRRWLLRR